MKPHACQYCERRFTTDHGLGKHIAAMHLIAPPPDAPKPGESGRRPTLAEIEPICIECGERAALTDGSHIYPHRPDLHHKRFWLCACGAYVGCHPGSVIPFGYPAGFETRRARSAAHEAFDPLWKQPNGMARAEAYAWLAAEIGIELAKCHIGMMTADQARAVTRASLARKKDMAA